jgi:hypothetical protein
MRRLTAIGLILIGLSMTLLGATLQYLTESALTALALGSGVIILLIGVFAPGKKHE